MTLRQLDDSDTVYRAISSYAGINRQGEILAGAFLRRLPNPETGKIRDESGVSIATSVAYADRLCPSRKAVCSIIVGAIRSIDLGPNLDVILNRIDHGNIINLPYPTGADKQLAEDLASELADLASPIPSTFVFTVTE